jgi:hypothetical protein
MLISITLLDKIIPVEPPIVNISKKIGTKNVELIETDNKEALILRYVHNQLYILLPVGIDIIIVTDIK